jgi:hypothetical protein
VTLEHLTVEQILAAGGVSAGLMLVRTFCWYWRLRCLRKYAPAALDKLGEVEQPLLPGTPAGPT